MRVPFGTLVGKSWVSKSKCISSMKNIIMYHKFLKDLLLWKFMVRRGMEIALNIIKLPCMSLNQNQTSPLGLGATLALTRWG
jgi:hypothetical protein